MKARIQAFTMVANRRWVALGAMLLWLGACSGEPPPADVGGAASKPIALKNFDLEPSGSDAEMDMIAGRLSKVPVSHVLHGRFQYVQSGSGTQRIHIRARCSDPSALTDQCDPAVVVARSTAGGLVSVDRVSGNGVGSQGRDAYFSFDYALGSGQFTLDVLAYSEFRGSSRVDLQWDATAPGTPPTYPTMRSWTNMITAQSQQQLVDQVVGGTLIRLGPTPAGTVSVNTPDDGDGDDQTILWLFNPSRVQYARVWPGTGDLDPSFQFTSAWGAGTSGVSETFALVGLRTPTLTGLDQEQFVQVSISPSSQDVLVDFAGPQWPECAGLSPPRDCANSAPGTVLQPGRYLISVWAHPGHYPTASLPDFAGHWHPATETGNSACGDGPYPLRGQGNDLAFVVELDRTDGVTTNVARRYVPRGALGMGTLESESNPWNRITLDLVVPADAVTHSYRVNIRNVHSSIRVKESWAYRSNPEAVELKVATANIEYSGSNMQGSATLKNVADFLGRGPDFGDTVQYTDARGAWRWETDIFGLNEIDLASGVNTMIDRLNGSSNVYWYLSNGKGIYDEAVFDARFNPIFMNTFAARQAPGASARGKFPLLNFSTTGCSSYDGTDDCGPGCNDCFLASEPYCGPFAVHDYFAVPAAARARAIANSGAASVDVPIAVFQVYFPTDFCGTHMGARIEATAALVERIDGILHDTSSGNNATNFNSSGVASATHPGNRIIVMGDNNMKHHRCGEGNEMLRALRARFGYAIDVSQAFVSPDDMRTADTHYSGSPLTDVQAGTYGPCQSDGNWSNLGFDGQTLGCPKHLKDTDVWHMSGAGRYDTDAGQWHDWWNGSGTENGGSGSRLDAIYLVGRGWANDDPVKDFRTIANLMAAPNRMNDYGTGAVEVRHDCEVNGDDGYVSTSAGYFPEFNPCSNENGGVAAKGTTAWRSDHKPIGARIRVLPAAYHTLSVTKAGLGGGTVTGPNGIQCGSSCSSSFVEGQSVVLVASGGTLGAFSHWVGCDSVSGTSCSVTIGTSDRIVTAHFNQTLAYSDLYVSKSGTGTGTITSNPTGISCGSTCYAQMTGTVLLTGTPSANSFLKAWTGAGTGFPIRTVVMNGGSAVATAQFKLRPVLSVTVNRTYTGGFTAAGTYVKVSSPSGSCNPTGTGGTCTYSYPNDTGSVTLTAAGATVINCTEFKGWSGACTNTAGTCTVSMNVAKSVTAMFGRKTGCIPQ